MTPFSTCHCSTSKTTEKGKQTPVGLAALSKFCLVKIEHNSISLEVPLASIETTRTSLRLQAGVSLSCILSCFDYTCGLFVALFWGSVSLVCPLGVVSSHHISSCDLGTATFLPPHPPPLWIRLCYMVTGRSVFDFLFSYNLLIHQYSSNEPLPFITPLNSSIAVFPGQSLHTCMTVVTPNLALFVNFLVHLIW